MLSLPIGPPELHAELRALDPWRAGEFAAFMREHGPSLYEWLPWERFEDEEQARAFLQSGADAAATDGMRLFGIWVDGELVGGTLLPAFSARKGIAEIGVWLGGAARGRGVVTHAVAAMIDWCFAERGIHRIEWRCSPENAPSRAIPQRLGFTREGVLRQAFDIRGRKIDLEMWSLLAEDPRPQLDGESGTVASTS